MYWKRDIVIKEMVLISEDIRARMSRWCKERGSLTCMVSCLGGVLRLAWNHGGILRLRNHPIRDLKKNKNQKGRWIFLSWEIIVSTVWNFGLNKNYFLFFIFYLKLFFIFLNYFNVMILNINFKNKKIILIYFKTKNNFITLSNIISSIPSNSN